MRLVSANVNGIRAAARRGGGAWLAAQDADVICLQEVRATDEQLRIALGDDFDDWHLAHRPSAVRLGHAGVAILSRWPLEVTEDLGEADEQGRWLAVRTGGLEVASVYVHTGEAETPAQDDKHRFLAAMGKWMEQRQRAVVCGDLNVAHREVDIKNWKGNRGKAGFLESERAYLDHWYGELGWADLGADAGYTWWSWRGKAFDNDAGWRIDCVLASPDLADACSRFTVARAATYAQRWSDHAPVVADFAI
ncbi:MAG: exodeoxyribonuclease III [Candidatus Nanopelagicales bacterium]